MTPTTIKSGDTNVVFTDVIQFNGAPFDLTGCLMEFDLRPNNGGLAYNATGTADPDQVANKGKVTCPASSVGFPTAVGLYNQDWKITVVSSTHVFHWPADGYNIVRIMESLH